MSNVVKSGLYILFSVPAFVFLCLLAGFTYMWAVALSGNSQTITLWFLLSSWSGILFPIGLLFFNSRKEKFAAGKIEKFIWVGLLIPILVIVRIVINFLFLKFVSLLPPFILNVVGVTGLTLLIEILFWGVLQLFFEYKKRMNTVKFALLATTIELVIIELLYLIPLVINSS